MSSVNRIIIKYKWFNIIKVQITCEQVSSKNKFSQCARVGCYTSNECNSSRHIRKKKSWFSTALGFHVKTLVYCVCVWLFICSLFIYSANNEWFFQKRYIILNHKNKVTIYHKNVLTQEHHELSMIVFHGIEIVFPYWSRYVIHSDANP